MITDINSEDRLIQQTFADHLRDSLGWESVYAWTEETFGPAVGLMPIGTLDEAIAHANDTPYGLAAFVFSRDLATALRAAERCEAGSVWVNDIHRSYDQVPFGGYKQSGLGREKSRHGLDEYLEPKTIYLSLPKGMGA